MQKALSIAALVAVMAAVGMSDVASAEGKGKGLGQATAPGQTGMSGMSGAPGQTGVKPAHPDNLGADASNCAKIADPKKKDECVKAAKAPKK